MMKDRKPTLWEKLQSLMYGLAFPTMTKRRLKFLLWPVVNCTKYIPWVMGVGIGGFIIGVCIAGGNGIAFSILLGVSMGAFSFWFGRLLFRLWLKYFLPAQLEMQGIEPAQLDPQYRVEPVTNVGRKVYRIFFACLLVYGFVLYITLAHHFLGVWGIPLAVVFCLLSTWFLWWRWKKVKSRKRLKAGVEDSLTVDLGWGGGSMKCAYHPDRDAVGACVNCGKLVCSECRTILREKIYCGSCANQLFVLKAAAPTVPAARYRSLMAGAVLSIIGGALSVLVGLAVLGYSYVGIIFLVPGAVALLGGVYALRRKKYGWSLAGAICALIPMLVPGVLV